MRTLTGESSPHGGMNFLPATGVPPVKNEKVKLNQFNELVQDYSALAGAEKLNL
jgi:hypothetical protein